MKFGLLSVSNSAGHPSPSEKSSETRNESSSAQISNWLYVNSFSSETNKNANLSLSFGLRVCLFFRMIGPAKSALV